MKLLLENGHAGMHGNTGTTQVCSGRETMLADHLSRGNKMKILDCTLRDGGYYTNWDFASDLVDTYVVAMNALPVDCIEVGYRNTRTSEYLGQFGYSPVATLAGIRSRTTKKLAVMLNEKSARPCDLDLLVKPVAECVDLVRIAVAPKNFDRALRLAEAIKGLGVAVGFNLMYMSEWINDTAFTGKLKAAEGVVDVLCAVDSYGGVTPDEVRQAIAEIKGRISMAVGFHGHNNLQFGLINALAAKEAGADVVDSTISGMGRGAGNLATELLLTYLNRREALPVDFNVLGDVVAAFAPLQKIHEWGTSLPYMISGANGIPQKDVMEWVSNRVYSFNSIVRALDNRRNHEIDNASFPKFTAGRKRPCVVVVGGGESAVFHSDAVKAFLAGNPDAALVFATARNAAAYRNVANDKYYCLVGNEGRRLMRTVGGKDFRGVCVLPPYPREMGTEVPSEVADATYELRSVSFTGKYRDSVTAVSLQLALEITDGEIFTIGYDGYAGKAISEKEAALDNENRVIFEAFRNATGKTIRAFVPTRYAALLVDSVYSRI